MRHFLAVTALCSLTLFLLAGCSIFGSGDGQIEADFTTQREQYDPGDGVDVSLRNQSSSVPFECNLCTSNLQRRHGQEWVRARENRACPMYARVLGPDQAATYSLTLSDSLDAGTYRYVQEVRAESGERTKTFFTNTFIVR